MQELVENPRDHRHAHEREAARADAVRQWDHLASAPASVERCDLTSFVNSRICFERASSSSFWRSSSLTVFHWSSAITCRLASARFWLIITNVDRKIASSETIIVSSPNGYFSTPRPIHRPNHTMWI